MTKDFFRSLKGKIAEDLLTLQKQQLFEKSIGADSKPLGRYDNNNRQYGTNRVRKIGAKYEMFNTGKLFEKMKVKINVGRREIEFINTRDGLEKPWFRYNLDVFGTDDWFGLTEENFAKFMNEYARPWIRAWTLNHIKHGSRKD